MVPWPAAGGRPLAAAAVAVAVAAAAAAPAAPPSAASVVATNFPVLTWPTRVNPSGVFAYRVTVSGPPPYAVDSGWIYAINEPFPGLWVLEPTPGGPALAPGGAYNWTVTEMQVAPAPGQPPVPQPPPTWVAGAGAFTASPSLPTAAAEAAAALGAGGNFSTLLSNGIASLVGRIQPCGYVPTSVSGGYGGNTSMFVRDTAAQVFALLELAGSPAAS
jgi:hypothetical protein